MKLFPYTIRKQRALREVDEARRVGLCRDFNGFLEDNPTVPRSMSFSDEVHFNWGSRHEQAEYMCVDQLTPA